MDLYDFASFALGLAAGMLFYLWRRSALRHEAGLSRQSERAILEERLRMREEQLARMERELQQTCDGLRNAEAARIELQANLESERVRAAEKLELLEQARIQLSDAFKALSSDALRHNNQSFLELAKNVLEKYQEGAKGELQQRKQEIDQVLQPVKESLERFDKKVQEVEKDRVGTYEALRAQVQALRESQSILQRGTDNLVRALSAPRVRGRWGEIQLKRVVELAGMLSHCDFTEQVTVTGEDSKYRPDLVVQLPGQKQIVVDAKAPLAAYLEALECQDEVQRLEKMKDHARQIRDHLTALSRKSYWEQFEATPEFVVLFLPGENFFNAALEHDPSLIEQGVDQRVILATPTTLIALLKAVAYGWQQDRLSDNAEQICTLGKELYKRMADFGEHLADLGSKLGRAVESYNRAIGTLETRVLVSTRRFRELDAATGDRELKVLDPVDASPRMIQAEELVKVGGG